MHRFLIAKINIFALSLNTIQVKDFRAFGVALVRSMTAVTSATAAITLARLFVEMLCYVLGRLYSSYVLKY